MKKYVAELLGTCSLVLFGCGAAVIAGKSGSALPAGIGLLGISLAFGLTVAVMAYAIGGISGCHINPAVTISMLVAGKIDLPDAAGYIVAQFAGATLGAAILLMIQSGAPGFQMGDWALGSNGWGTGYLGNYNTTSAFATEAIFTFLFLFVILAVTSKMGNGNMAGLAIGLSLVLIHLIAIPVTGTSVNPARSFGPAVLSGGIAMHQLWLFIVAPVLGGSVAALLWRSYFEPK